MQSVRLHRYAQYSQSIFIEGSACDNERLFQGAAVKTVRNVAFRASIPALYDTQFPRKLKYKELRTALFTLQEQNCIVNAGNSRQKHMENQRFFYL